MYKKTFSRSKYNLICALFCLCCALPFLFQVNCLAEERARTIMDIIPYDTIAYLSISNLDAVSQTVVNLPEWKELYSMDEVKEGLAQPEQVMTMLLGLTPEELVKILGHKLVFSFLGIENNIPVACLAIDTGENKDQAQYVIEQLVSVAALSGQMVPREGSYREVPYTGISLGEIKIGYGFIDDFILAGVNGGFEKMVDLHKDGGENIEDNPNFQFIGQKVNLSSEIALFANVEQLIPMLPELQRLRDKDASSSEQSETDKEFQELLEKLVLNSIKGFGVSLSLSGLVHEAYLHVEPNAANPLFELLLTSHPTMSSIQFLPVDGVLAGIQIGDPVALLDSMLNLADLFGQNKEDIENQIRNLEEGFGLNLRDDVLSTLTGEVGVMALLPKEDVDLKKNKLHFAKFRPIILLGVKDRKKLEETASKLTRLAQIETQTLKEEKYRGFNIYTKLLPLDMLVPGVAFMPSLAYKDDMLIISNSKEWVKDAVDMLTEPRQTGLDPEIEKELKSSWILAFVNAGEIAHFVTQQDLTDEIKLPENAMDKLKDFGSVIVSYSAEPDGIGVGILSENPWMTEILRAVVLGIYAEQAKEEQTQEKEQPKE